VKKQIVFASLVAFMVWPLVQHVVARSTGMNAWRYAGWAGYSTPQRVPEVLLWADIGGKRWPINGDTLSPLASQKLFVYLSEVSAEATMANADPLSEQLLTDLVGASAIYIERRHFALDPATANVKITSIEHADDR
jgi:hypothetical protein